MIINHNDLQNIRSFNKDKKIILALGSFDLLHFEHLNFLNDAKKLGDILVVAVKDDESVNLKGKDRPIIDENQRLLLIDNLKCTDYSIITNEYYDMKDFIQRNNLADNVYVRNWLKIFYNIFDKLRPDVLYYEENNLFQPAREVIKNIFKISLINRVRTELISTTKIINKIRSSNEKSN